MIIGGRRVSAFHSEGFLFVRETVSRIMAVAAVNACERTLTTKEYKGGGRLALIYSIKGLRNGGSHASMTVTCTVTIGVGGVFAITLHSAVTALHNT